MTINPKGFLHAALTAAILLAASLAAPEAKADGRMDRLILCSAIFNASLAFASNDALKKEYEAKTLEYAEAALKRAKELEVSEEAFKQRAGDLGANTTITQDSLPAERSRCLNEVSRADQ